MEAPEEPFYTESKGVANGVNPFFGEWHQEFRFPPVSHTAKGDKRQEFQKRLQSEIACVYYFTDEVKVDITLHLDEQRVRESDSTADVDNFAKGILDCLKGKFGIMIDDCQIQSLSISWIDIYTEDEWFEVTVKGHPDEFMLRDITLYEMPDGLWYPISNKTWDNGVSKPKCDIDVVAAPLLLEIMTEFTNKLRAVLRQSGLNRMQAYRKSQYFATPARGFHKSRVEGSFPLAPLKKWREAVPKLDAKDQVNAKKIIGYIDDFKAAKNERLKEIKKSLPTR